MKSAYIAGPMRGYARFNFDTFFQVEAEAIERGWLTHNPARHDLDVYPDIITWDGFDAGTVDDAFDLPAAMQWDLARVIEADAIIMLPGWENSSGARCERLVAERCGRAVYLAFRCDDGWSIAADPIQRRMGVWSEVAA